MPWQPARLADSMNEPTMLASMRRRAAKTSRASRTDGLDTMAPRLGIRVTTRSCASLCRTCRSRVRPMPKIPHRRSSTSRVSGGRLWSMIADQIRSYTVAASGPSDRLRFTGAVLLLRGMNLAPQYIRMTDDAIVSETHEHQQLVRQGPRARHPPGQQLGGPG